MNVADVGIEIVNAIETFVAQFARERLFSGVDSHVSLQMRLARGYSSTQMALVLFLKPSLAQTNNQRPTHPGT